MNMDKPYKGEIAFWRSKQCIPKIGRGYYIIGHSISHPQFRDGPIRTSEVVEHNFMTGEIETKNSRYTLRSNDIKGKPMKQSNIGNLEKVITMLDGVSSAEDRDENGNILNQIETIIKNIISEERATNDRI